MHSHLNAQETGTTAPVGDEARNESVSTIPVYFPGNATCKFLNDSSDPAFSHIATDYELRLNFEPQFGSSEPFPFTGSASGPFVRELTGPPSPADSVAINRNNNAFNWTSTRGISAVIVNGANGSNVYVYPRAAFIGEYLTAPAARNINYVSYCYYVPARVTIVKEVQTFNGENSSTVLFPFTTTNFTPSNFSLIDNNAPPADRVTNASVYSFGAANAVRVTESIVNNWTLGDIFCVETAGGAGGGFPDLPNSQNTTANLGTRTANIILEQGENVTCTFSGLQISLPANASVSGRVLTQTGLPVKRALITFFNVSRMETQFVYTNALGYYRLNGLPTFDQYVLTVSHSKRNFSDNSRSFTLNDDLSEVNFVAVY